MTQPSPADRAEDVLTAPVRMVSGLLPGADAANSVADAATAVRRWVSERHNWVRVSWFITGVTIAWIGVVVLARKPIGGAMEATGLTPSQLKATVSGAAKTAVTKGRA